MLKSHNLKVITLLQMSVHMTSAYYYPKAVHIVK